MNQWPAAAVVMRKTSDLVPYARNSRKHSDAQIAQIMASIQEWGWTIPVLVDEDSQIIAGHARHEAAQRLGLLEVPALQASGWSEAQKRAYVIADNKLTENGEWDFDMLAIELGDLGDFDLSLTGFDDIEIADILAEVEETGLPGLPSGDKEPFQQMTFTLHDEQAEQVERALAASKGMGDFIGTPNENSNGNALARVCETFVLRCSG